MKKIVKSLVGVLGCTVILTGCVQLPPVPDAMKVSTYNNTDLTSKKNGFIDVRTLTGDTKLSCELMYCTAHIENKNLDKSCKPAWDRLDSLQVNAKSFNEQQNIAQDFIKLCPYKNTIDSPFN